MNTTPLKKKLKNIFNLITRDHFYDILITDINGNTIISNNEKINAAFFNPGTDKTIIEIDHHNKFALYIKLREITGADRMMPGYYGILKEVLRDYIFYEFEIQSLSNEILDKYEELNLIYDIISELKTVFNENDICNIILKKAVQIIPVQLGFMVLLNPEENHPSSFFIFGRKTDLPEKDLNLFFELTEESISAKKVVYQKNPQPINAKFISAYALKPEPELLSIPMKTGEEVFGAIALVDKQDETNFTSIDMKLISALASQAAESIRSSRLIREMNESEAIRREMQIAHDIQMSLIPESFPVGTGLDIAGMCLPSAYAGGDFYSFDEYNNGKIMFSIADVSGHGLSSSFIMVSLRSILRSEIKWAESLKECIECSNQMLLKDTLQNEKYATLLALTFEKKTAKIRLVDAGHLPPVYWNNKEKQVENISIEKGFPLGLFSENVYIEKEMSLNKGDILLLYTDGITEARNSKKEFFGGQRLKDLVALCYEKSAEEIRKLIHNEVISFQEGSPQKDDITLVVIKLL